MVIKVASIALNGIDAVDVNVEVQLISGIPNFVIVGLADKTISESKERVRSALSAIGLALPVKRIVINLAPAHLIKEGSHFDLAIAAGILASTKILNDEIRNYLILGELSLDGSILPVNGILPAAMAAVNRDKGIICSKDNGAEASWSGNKKIIAASNLLELINHFKGTQIISYPSAKIEDEIPSYLDLVDIKGQKIAKRALEIAAAGNHNLLMSGPPGTGKSMLAQRLIGIMPPLSSQEILECSVISSISGKLKNGALTRKRPFRSPHHSCSTAAMVGGGVGRKITPGEISLAHNGILFLDELPEFNNNVIESLRQPMETGEILIARASNHIKYPAQFQLIAAMNPCKCGYLNDNHRVCTKAPACASIYQSKISGPILDRFDLHVEVNNESHYNHYKLDYINNEESSEKVKERVIKARNIQIKRYEGYNNINSNNQLEGKLITNYAIASEEGMNILNEAAQKFKLSMRAYNKILKVGRTIADLDNSELVSKIHIAESLSYRKLDFSSTLSYINHYRSKEYS